MYYTPEMARAFRSITPPPTFTVDIVEHVIEGMSFLEIVCDERKFVSLVDDEKRGAVEYMIRVKKALEDNGAMVQLTRKAVER
jgi:hypothetical protein